MGICVANPCKMMPPTAIDDGRIRRHLRGKPPPPGWLQARRYEADANAHWVGAATGEATRLATEAEFEIALAPKSVTGNFAGTSGPRPAPAGSFAADAAPRRSASCA